jgi:hypothetical protein
VGKTRVEAGFTGSSTDRHAAAPIKVGDKVTVIGTVLDF